MDDDDDDDDRWFPNDNWIVYVDEQKTRSETNENKKGNSFLFFFVTVRLVCELASKCNGKQKPQICTTRNEHKRKRVVVLRCMYYIHESSWLMLDFVSTFPARHVWLSLFANLLRICTSIIGCFAFWHDRQDAVSFLFICIYCTLLAYRPR